MANYYASARSNYFKVKDPVAFTEWAGSISGIGYWEGHNENEGMFAIYDDGEDACGWPCMAWDDDGGEREIDLLQELSEHLTDDTVAVLIEAGAEKLRYICGFAQAVNSKGEVESISLDEIYSMAEERFGIKPTTATY